MKFLFFQPDAFITSVQVIPLASTRKTEASNIDWTCIAIALSSGYVNFYTERGVHILTEKFAPKKIDVLRFGRSVYPGDQELAALSGGRVYLVEGLSLFAGLKTARNEVRIYIIRMFYERVIWDTVEQELGVL